MLVGYSSMGSDKALKLIRQALAFGETHLDLTNLDLQELPSEIAWLTDLSSLELSSNRLVDIPAEIGSLTKLRSLDLKRNRLRVIAPSSAPHRTTDRALTLGNKVDHRLPSLRANHRSLSLISRHPLCFSAPAP